MRIFLTGASGQIGKAIAILILGDDVHIVTGMSRRPNRVQGLSSCIVADLATANILEQVTRFVAPCDANIHSSGFICRTISPTIPRFL